MLKTLKDYAENELYVLNIENGDSTIQDFTVVSRIKASVQFNLLKGKNRRNKFSIITSDQKNINSIMKEVKESISKGSVLLVATGYREDLIGINYFI